MFLKNKFNEKLEKKLSLIMLIINVVFIVILDQITKYIISVNIPVNHGLNIIPNFLNIIHIHNPGGAFGFMSTTNESIRYFLFIGMAFVSILFIVCFYLNIHNHYKLLSIGLSLIVGGAIGNIFDRIRFGKVVDFIDFFIFQYHWPAFNIADTSIMIGITILIFYSLIGKIPE